MLPGLLVAGIVGIIVGELPIPVPTMGFTPIWRYGEIIKGYTIFGAPGFPPY